MIISRLSALTTALCVILLSPYDALSCTVDDVNSFSFYADGKMKDISKRVVVYEQIHNYFEKLHSRIPVTTPETKRILDKLEYSQKYQRVDYKIMEAKDNLQRIKTVFSNLKRTSKELQEDNSYRVADASFESALLSEAIYFLTNLYFPNSLTAMSEIGLLEQPDERGYIFGCSLLAGRLTGFNADLSFEIYTHLELSYGGIADEQFKF